jgi:uncharacterized protein
MRFTWDSQKEAANLAKHEVSFFEAHSPRGGYELRWWLLGKVDERVMLVRYTHRPNGVIRIIGAGYWGMGAKIYEEKNRTD